MQTDIQQSSLSSHALQKYFPRSDADRKGIALCLSGGGYRAALFHLGALRRLNELGILPQITTISSVSGGSVISGLLAAKLHWPLKEPGSDAFNIEPDRRFARRVVRHIWILFNQSVALRKRWLITNFESELLEGAYWGMGSAASSYVDGSQEGYSKDLAQRFISQIRTDFDVFSEAEIAVTENHGYIIADAAIRKHQPGLIAHDMKKNLPHDGWDNEERVERALTGSDRHRVFGRFR